MIYSSISRLILVCIRYEQIILHTILSMCEKTIRNAFLAMSVRAFLSHLLVWFCGSSLYLKKSKETFSFRDVYKSTFLYYVKNYNCSQYK